MAEESVRSSVEEEHQEEELYDVTTRWVIPQKIEHMAFIGKNVLAIATDVYIIFFNYKNNTEIIYTPNCKEKGDGVDCIATHKNRVFVFAEKVNHARIFVMIYPTFEILGELIDFEVNRYKAVCMTEMDMVVGFSGFPTYVMTGWNWRTKQRLICVPTDVVRRDQIYLSSSSHMMVVECWGSGLHVWDIAMCYRRALILRRSTLEKREARERQGPKLVDVCWSHDALLYAVDERANIYNVLSDNINSILTLEWSEEIEGDEKPCLCTFGNGILLYGPDHNLRCLKKGEDKTWVVAAVIPQKDVILKLIANSNNDMCAVYTARGMLYWVQGMEDNPMITPCSYKQRNILKAQMIAPTYEYLVLIDHGGTLVVYDIATAQLVTILQLKGNDISIQASPVDPLIVAYGEVGSNYGMKLLSLSERRLQDEGHVCLTNQIVSHVAFSSSGREIVVGAMSAGHVFLYNVSESYKLTLVRYTELGRGLADSFLMPVAGIMRCFNIVLFSDKYKIGERITCINAETGRDNKFAGKMQGPYSRLLPLGDPNTMLAVPHLSRNFHILKLSADKGVTVTVRMGAIIDTGLDIKSYDAFFNTGALITFGYDGHVILRQPNAPPEYDLKLVATHRYNNGIRQALIDDKNTVLVTLAENYNLCVRYLNPHPACDEPVEHEVQVERVFAESDALYLFPVDEKNYLDILEEKRVHEEAMDYKRQREDVIRLFHIAQARLVELLEENINEVPLHQLSLSEFNLHFENKKERYKEAEKERELIRLKTEARIKAQDEVTAWIKKTCWDSMATHRTKILGIFTHYQVENYACIPAEHETWPELQLVEAYRTIEAENDAELFRPWEEYDPDKEQESVETVAPPAPTMDAKVSASLRSMTTSARDMRKSFESTMSVAGGATLEDEDSLPGEPHALLGSSAHLYITPPAYSVPQTLRFSYLHMELCKHLCRLNVHKMRNWFNKEFDALQVLKRREVGLVAERNARLRFIIEELNKLSDLRESFHHLTIVIQDPQWQQEEEPERLIRVEPEECSIEPYISPSQIVIIPPDPGPKDDFRERALIEMMDGVLEKLWHEEIKKPIPPPQCMLDKSPEHFNEEDLRQVFEWEKKVEFRKEERNKYRKMLHAEYAKLSGVLNDGIVKFNEKVKELYLTKLRVDAVIGQESLLLMRQRRVNLDRIEAAEKTEVMRSEIYRYEQEIVKLQEELKIIQQQSDECQLTYEALQVREKQLERAFKNAFNDLSPVIMDQCAKFYRKRPKWHMHTLSPSVMYELAAIILAGVKPPLSMYPECLDYIKSLEHMDQPSNMPAVLDESSWATIVRMRRNKIELEIRTRAIVTETAAVDLTFTTWSKVIQARKSASSKLHDDMMRHRHDVELTARNKTIQLVMPAGQVEITTTGHFEDFDDAALVLREEVQKINDLILKVGALKLRMMRRQIEFRKGILAKEWLHAQMKMKLRHAEQELYSYRRLKIPKELQLFLKNKELGYTEEFEYQRMEKEMEASRVSVTRILDIHIQAHNELQFRITSVELKIDALQKVISKLNVKASENRINEDPLEPIRIRKKLKKRMEAIVERSRLIRQVQQNHSAIVLQQTELELLRLKTYPTLASFEILS